MLGVESKKTVVDVLIASDKGADVNKAYIAELETDNGLIAFVESEAVKSVTQYVCDFKVVGRKYCNCQDEPLAKLYWKRSQTCITFALCAMFILKK